jgi:hypothetical protein
MGIVEHYKLGEIVAGPAATATGSQDDLLKDRRKVDRRDVVADVIRY